MLQLMLRPQRMAIFDSIVNSGNGRSREKTIEFQVHLGMPGYERFGADMFLTLGRVFM